MFESGFHLCFLLLPLLILHFMPRISAIRKDIGFQETKICRNTVQGRFLLSDDNGHVCDALSVDPQSRCCPERGEKFSCHGCNLLSQCCNSYEFCVSCCLNPARTQEEEVIKLKIAKPSTAGTYASIFDFCAGRCRHNSESVVHENAYLSDFHHCFSLPSNMSAANYTQLEARLVGINVIVGRQGESCDSACKANGQSCVSNKLLVLNQCDIMQKYMSCKGTCLASIGADQPAEVVDNAPKHLEPACILEHNQCFRVMAPISILGDYAPAHSFCLEKFCPDDTREATIIYFIYFANVTDELLCIYRGANFVHKTNRNGKLLFGLYFCSFFFFFLPNIYRS